MEGNARIAYCGLYCPLCSFVAAAETKDREHLLAMPKRYDHLKQDTLEECGCAGCRDQVDRCRCKMKPGGGSKGMLVGVRDDTGSSRTPV